MTSAEPASSEHIFKVENLKVHFPILGGVLRRPVGWVHAVDGVSFAIRRGETLGVVGESGCGKTTTGRALLRLVRVTGGSITYFAPAEDGKASSPVDLAKLKARDVRHLRRRIQIIFQDPSSSLDPRQLVKSIVGEPIRIHGMTALKCVQCGALVPIHLEAPGATCNACGGTTKPVPLHGADLEARIIELLERVGLNPEHMFRFPHEFSGGQKQRIAITRALALKPAFLVLDEPTSSLDVSVQAQILNLLKDLQRDYGLTYMFITHNLSVVRHMADRIAVMYLGRFIEVADKRKLFDRPLHPYTKGLLESIPIPDPARRRELALMKGEVPTPVNPPLGCRFHPRCPVALPHCGWEARDLQRSLEDAVRDSPESPLAQGVRDMESDGVRLRVRLKGDSEAAATALRAFLDDGAAKGLPMYQAVEGMDREGDAVVVRFLNAKEPQLKEVEPDHAVACYLY